jgi:hypothetical protein
MSRSFEKNQESKRYEHVDSEAEAVQSLAVPPRLPYAYLVTDLSANREISMRREANHEARGHSRFNKDAIYFFWRP